jgi:methyltransferase (TIGR00027 family)
MRTPEAIIGSAETVAFARALAALDPDPSLRCPDDLACRLINGSMRAMLQDAPALRKRLDQSFPGVYAFHIARTKFTDQVLVEELGQGAEQIVILGAGLDTRAFRFAHLLSGVRVYELDFPGNQRQKLQRIEEAGLDIPESVAYLPIDFVREDLADILECAGFRPDRRSVFVWDGVSYYLDEASVRRILGFVGRSRPARKAIAFDYALRSFVEGDRSPYGSKEIGDHFWSKGEPFLFGLNPQETAPFLASCGLRTCRDYGPEELRSRFVSSEQRSEPLPFVGVYRMAYAQTADGDVQPCAGDA